MVENYTIRCEASDRDVLKRFIEAHGETQPEAAAVLVQQIAKIEARETMPETSPLFDLYDEISKRTYGVFQAIATETHEKVRTAEDGAAARVKAAEEKAEAAAERADTAVAEADAKVAELTATAAKVPGLEAEVERLAGEVDRLAAERDAATSARLKAESEAETDRHAADKAKGDYADALKQAKDAGDAKAKAEQEAARAVNELMAAQAASSEKDKRIAELTERLNKSEGKADALADQVDAARAEANDLRAQLSAAGAKADALKEQVDMLRELLEQQKMQADR